MKNLVNVKNLKKIGIGILPIMFLLVTLVPGNLLGVNYTADAEVHLVIRVVDPTSDTGASKTIDPGSTTDYSGSPHCKNFGEQAGKAKGTIAYIIGTDGKPTLTLKDLDIAVASSLISVDGDGTTTDDDITIKLEGNNNIKYTKESSGAGVINSMRAALKFTGDGNLTIDGGMASTIGSYEADTQVEFSGSGLIKLSGGKHAQADAVRMTGLKVTSGTVEIDGHSEDLMGDVCGILGNAKLTGGHLIIKNNSSNSGLNAQGSLSVGKDAKLSVISAEGAKGTPILLTYGEAIIDGYVQAIGSANSEYGIATPDKDRKTTINHGATVEAYGAQKGALEMEGFEIGDGLWSAIVGESKEQAKALLNMDAKTLKEELVNGQYKYVKMGAADNPSIIEDIGAIGNAGTDGNASTDGNAGTAGNAGGSSTNKKDGVPSTSDTTNIISYVLLLIAGAFTVIIANKKTIFDK